MKKHSDAMIVSDDDKWIGSVYKDEDGKFFVLNDTGAYWKEGERVSGTTSINSMGRDAAQRFKTMRAAKICFRKAWKAAGLTALGLALVLSPIQGQARTYEPCTQMQAMFNQHGTPSEYQDYLMNEIGCRYDTLLPVSGWNSACSHVAYRYAKVILRKTGGSFWTTPDIDPVSFVAEHTIGYETKYGACFQFEDGSYSAF